MSHDAGEADHPGCELDVDVGELGAEEEGPVGVGHVDDLGDFVFELVGVFGLFGEFLRSQELVEGGYDIAVNLGGVSLVFYCQSKRVTYMIGPKSAVGS